MHYDPRTGAHGLPYDPFKSCTVPRPIGWISTVDRDGNANLAPYSQWQNLTYDPPTVMFAANPKEGGVVKDSVRNAEATGWFVFNMATWALREAVNISAMELPAGEDEFLRAGLTKAPSIDAPCPRVAESPVQFECRHFATLRVPGDSDLGHADLVIGRVARIHIDDRVILPDGKLDIARIAPIARMGYYDYAVVRETFEMRIPQAGGTALRGLEGAKTR